MEQKILELYETTLGKIKFFQKFIRLLHLMYQNNEKEVNEIKDELAEMQEKFNQLKEEFDNLPIPTTDKTKETIQDFTKNTSASIMDKYYEAHTQEPK